MLRQGLDLCQVPSSPALHLMAQTLMWTQMQAHLEPFFLPYFLNESVINLPKFSSQGIFPPVTFQNHVLIRSPLIIHARGLATSSQDNV